MDCQQARRELDVQDRPGELPEAAVAHVSACPGCARVIDRRRQFDAEVAAAMADVALPDGLRERLLARLANAETDASAPGVSVPSSESSLRRSHRVRWAAFRSVAAAMLLLAAFVAGSFVVRPASGLSMQNWQQLAQEYVQQPPADLPAASRGLPLPSLSWRTQQLHMKGPYPLEHGNFTANIYLFQTVRRGRPIQGGLLVLPRDAVSDVPTQTTFHTDEIAYQGGKTGVAWTEGELVYYCWVDGTKDDLDRLYQIIEGGSFA